MREASFTAWLNRRVQKPLTVSQLDSRIHTHSRIGTDTFHRKFNFLHDTERELAGCSRASRFPGDEVGRVLPRAAWRLARRLPLHIPAQ